MEQTITNSDICGDASIEPPYGGDPEYLEQYLGSQGNALSWKVENMHFVSFLKLKSFFKTCLQSLKVATMQRFDIKVETVKPGPLDELIAALKKLLNVCLCCITCGCYRGNNGDRLKNGELYQVELLDSERQAVANLLQYLDNEIGDEATIDEERLRAICILTFSDNLELQRSAALCYAEISAKMREPLTDAMAEPLIALLKCKDVKIEKAATLAISNFLLYGHVNNKDILVNAGAMKPLIELLSSSDLEVQCNTCGCITTIATSEAHKQLIISEDGVKHLLILLKSPDRRVQRNAAGAILNLTHSQSNRNELVHRGAIPILVELLRSRDADIQYYCTAALSNIAINEKHRTMMVAVGHQDVLRNLIKLMATDSEKVKCQACLALRNLASDSDNQVLIVKHGAIPAFISVIRRSKGETLSASLACVRNLCIHKTNELCMIQSGLLKELYRVVQEMRSNSEAQRHAVGALRNIAVGEHITLLVESGVVEALVVVLLDSESRPAVLTEVTAALAVLTDDDVVKRQLISMYHGRVFTRLVATASLSNNPEVQYNSAGILGQLSFNEIPSRLKELNTPGVIVYVDRFLKSPQPNFIHIALWTLVQLLKDDYFVEAFREVHIDQVVRQVSSSPHPSAILDLCDAVLSDLNSDTSPEEEDSPENTSLEGSTSHAEIQDGGS